MTLKFVCYATGPSPEINIKCYSFRDAMTQSNRLIQTKDYITNDMSPCASTVG